MKPFGALISFEEAKRVIEENIEPITGVEIIKIDDGVGRVLAEDVLATLSTPPFDRAAMDGYAVKARDTFDSSRSNPRVLSLVGELRAGDTPRKRVGTGECIRIATGAMLPGGADAVVMVEDTEAEDRRVKVFKPVYPKAKVARKGEDIKEGELILGQGLVLDPGKIGVLASQGMSRVHIYEKPKVAVLPTGEEVAEVGKKLKRGQVYDINSYTVSSVVKASGGISNRFGITGDTREEIKSAIEEALKSDLVVISGGSSVGERDLLTDVIRGWGKILFHGVQIKPGMPVLFAKIDGKPVFGMPGFPTSCLVTTHLFVAPAIRRMAHLPPKRGEVVKARLSQGTSSSLGRRKLFTVRLEGDTAIPVYKESGDITSMSRADGYIEIPENTNLLEKGESVLVTLF